MDAQTAFSRSMRVHNKHESIATRHCLESIKMASEQGLFHTHCSEYIDKKTLISLGYTISDHKRGQLYDDDMGDGIGFPSYIITWTNYSQPGQGTGLGRGGK